MQLFELESGLISFRQFPPWPLLVLLRHPWLAADWLEAGCYRWFAVGGLPLLQVSSSLPGNEAELSPMEVEVSQDLRSQLPHVGVFQGSAIANAPLVTASHITHHIQGLEKEISAFNCRGRFLQASPGLL